MITNFAEWEESIPELIKADSLWNLKVYRLALFLADIAWYDVTRLVQERQTVSLADQLYRAIGSISANIAEGYSRGTGKDRARFYEYALGSAREGRDWYFKARYVLSDTVFSHRLSLLTNIIRLLLTMIPEQRGKIIREPQAKYHLDNLVDLSSDEVQLEILLQTVPLPNLHLS
ncbi:MAG: four helix bundle protein [Chloroflexi bacterium]|nr:MAG: four helix bundle protein [Chloroflexota bacterium]